MANKRLAPKERWLKVTSGSAAPGQLSESAHWAQRTDDPAFQAQCERALVEYVCRQTPDPTLPGGMTYRIQGAKEVLNVLLNLGEPDKPVVKTVEEQLRPT